MTEPIKSPEDNLAGIDAITGRVVLKESLENRLCPQCGKHGVTGDAYHQAGVCRICGWHHPWDD